VVIPLPSFPCVPNVERALCNRYVVNAIYSGAKGAKLINITELDGDTWVVDCDAEVNVSFKIGGFTYPIHPLDVTQPTTDDYGNTYCFGTVRVTSPQSFVCQADLRSLTVPNCDPWGTRPDHRWDFGHDIP
jgi:hypothetical protein